MLYPCKTSTWISQHGKYINNSNNVGSVSRTYGITTLSHPPRLKHRRHTTEQGVNELFVHIHVSHVSEWALFINPSPVGVWFSTLCWCQIPSVFYRCVLCNAQAVERYQLGALLCGTGMWLHHGLSMESIYCGWNSALPPGVNSISQFAHCMHGCVGAPERLGAWRIWGWQRVDS